MEAIITIVGLIILGVAGQVIPKMVENHNYKQYIKRRNER